MSTRTIDVRKESPDLKGLLSLVADGAEVVLTEGDTPIARLIPFEKRVAGLHAGAISMSEDFDAPLPDEFRTGNACNLCVKLEHMPAPNRLPNHHKDPFDRLLIAQARIEEAVPVSNDAAFTEYPVEVVWQQSLPMCGK